MDLSVERNGILWDYRTTLCSCISEKCREIWDFLENYWKTIQEQSMKNS